MHGGTLHPKFVHPLYYLNSHSYQNYHDLFNLMDVLAFLLLEVCLAKFLYIASFEKYFCQTMFHKRIFGESFFSG